MKNLRPWLGLIAFATACEPHFLDDTAPLPVWADTAAMTGRAVAVSLEASRTGLLAFSLSDITGAADAAAYRDARGLPDDCPSAEASTAGTIFEFRPGCVAGHETVGGTIVLARADEEMLVVLSNYGTRWMTFNGRLRLRPQSSTTGALRLEIVYALEADVIQGAGVALGEALDGAFLWSADPREPLDAASPVGGGYELRYGGRDDRGTTRVLSLVPQNLSVAGACRYPRGGALDLAQNDVLFGTLRFGRESCIGGDATMVSLDGRSQPVDLNRWRGGCTAPEVCDAKVQQCLQSCDVDVQASDCATACSASFCAGSEFDAPEDPEAEEATGGEDGVGEDGEPVSVEPPQLNCDDRWELCIRNRCPPEDTVMGSDEEKECLRRCDTALLRCALTEPTAPTDNGVDACRVKF